MAETIDFVLDDHLKSVFETETLHQGSIVRASVALLNEGLKDDRGDAGAAGMKIWFGIDALLGAVANISKIFFPTRNASEDTRRRCAALCHAFDVDPGGLLASRQMRDNFEHFDERIERWFRNSTRHNFADRGIGPKSAIRGLDETDYIRWFDPGTATLSLLRDELNVQTLVTEVVALLERVEAAQAVRWGRP